MSFRRAELYVAPDTHRRLRWIAAGPASSADHKVTPDEVGDRLLNKIIEQEFPQIKRLEKRHAQFEEKIIESLEG